LTEKLGAKFFSSRLGYSLVRISRLYDAFSGILELEARPVVGQQLQVIKIMGGKGKAKKKSRNA